jgi:histidinol-phosphate/aromatic aminotransferase/cobyric acid decarboxylase-like protein
VSCASLFVRRKAKPGPNRNTPPVSQQYQPVSNCRTFSKALGGAGGGFIAGRREVIHWLRQKAPHRDAALHHSTVIT